MFWKFINPITSQVEIVPNVWKTPGVNFGMFKPENLKLMWCTEIRYLERYVNFWKTIDQWEVFL